MSDEGATNLESLRRNVQTRKESLTTRLDTATQEHATARGTLAAGTRVFDQMSGRDGVVSQAPRNAAASSRAIFVRLDTGGLVARAPEFLIVRPTPPAGE